MESLSGALRTMKTRSLAESAFVASSDGLVLDAISDDGVAVDSIAAYAAGSVSVAERMGEDAELGAPQSVIHLYGNKTLMIAPVGPALLVLVGNGRSQLGMMRVQLQAGLADLRSALERDLFGPGAEQPAADASAPASAPAATNGHTTPARPNLDAILEAAVAR
ncbi:MAG TPA: roadblock/LC7 domain-containing protein [bacterium]|jgi:predicted regulator of Ras-like GTPase activity (Roadblock/LC7/MglB family)